jgi:uncharacterized protein (TIGR03086 family)
MTGTETAMALTGGGIALLERAMGYTLGSLLLVTPERMGNATPCRGWDLGRLLLHMNDSLLALHEAVAVGHIGLDPAGDYGDPGADPVATLRNRACRMIGAWTNAGESGEVWVADRTLASDVVAVTGALEVAVHGWDVARACGQDRPVPPALAQELLELCPHLVDETDRPTRFAAPVAVPPLASPGDRLVAYLGRRPW